MTEEKKTSTLSYNERRILAALSWGEKTKRELMDQLGTNESPTIKWLRILQAKGLVYVAGKKPQRATQPAPIYAVHVWHEMPSYDKQKATTGKNADRLQSIIDALAECGPMVAEELSEWIGCDRSLIDSAITHHRKGGRCSDVLRINSWVYIDRPRTGWTPQFTAGPGRDADKPVVERREYMARWRERNRAKIRASDALLRLNKFGKASAATNPFSQLFRAVGVIDHSCKRKLTEGDPA
jgi:hypothetical protein